MQVEEPAFFSEDSQELNRGFDCIQIGSAFFDRWVFAVDRGRRGPTSGLCVYLETLVKAKGAIHPAVSEQPSGSESGIGEDLGGQSRFGRHNVLKPCDSGSRRIQARPQGCHGALRPRGLSDLMREAHPATGHLVEHRAGIALVSPGAQVIRSQGIDQNEEDIDIVALAQGLDVRRRADWPVVSGHPRELNQG